MYEIFKLKSSILLLCITSESKMYQDTCIQSKRSKILLFQLYGFGLIVNYYFYLFELRKVC